MTFGGSLSIDDKSRPSRKSRVCGVYECHPRERITPRATRRRREHIGPRASPRVRMFCSSVSSPSAVSALASPRPGSRASRAAHRCRAVVMAGASSSASFVGMWRREGEKSVGSVEYLQAHGLTPEKAAARAVAPYQHCLLYTSPSPRD